MIDERLDKTGLTLQHVTKSFKRRSGEIIKAINDVTLDIDMGEFLVLLGPSGCGKTTLLRCVAGLEQPDTGRIELTGQKMFDSSFSIAAPPERRQIGMMFQSYALWPHMTVEQNILFPLKMRRTDAAVAGRRVDEIMETMRISDLAQQFPGAMSGGQQQRVALARALVCGDKLILFDEPLSNVDAKVREHLRFELLAMQRELGFTALYVTHDQDEAMALATRIAVISAGAVAQLGTPQDIYRRPRSAYVAHFVGLANMIEGTLLQNGTTQVFDTPLGILPIRNDHVFARQTSGIGISRPESWSISVDEPATEPRWRGRIKASMFLGSHNEYLVALDRLEIKVWSIGEDLLSSGQDVWCTTNTASLVVIDR